MKSTVSLKKVLEILEQNDNFLLLCHTNPDADTLGSALALRKTLENIGKTAQIAVDVKIPENLLFLTDGINEFPAPDIADAEKYFIISVDVASEGMLGKNKIFAPYCALSIDHHESHQKFAKNVYIRPNTIACGEIIYEIVSKMARLISFCEEVDGQTYTGIVMQEACDEDIAALLYAAIYSDSGGFKFSDTSPKTMRTVARLMEYGIAFPKIANCIQNEKNPMQMAAMNFAFANMKFAYDGKISFVRSEDPDKEKYGFGDSESADIITVLRYPKGVLANMYIRKCDGKDEYKISLRANADINVAEICEKYGGGGHKKAAGCNIPAENIDKAQEEILATVEKLLRGQNA